MKSTDLSLEQLRRLVKTTRPMVAFLQKLRHRMETIGFPAHDRLLRDAKIAEQVLADFVSESETLANYKQKEADPFR